MFFNVEKSEGKMRYNRINNNYTDLKEIHEELKNRKYEDDGCRFEDISPDLAELDRLGKVDYACYTDYYTMAKNRNGDHRPFPSGLMAKNKNYTY